MVAMSEQELIIKPFFSGVGYFSWGWLNENQHTRQCSTKTISKTKVLSVDFVALSVDE